MKRRIVIFMALFILVSFTAFAFDYSSVKVKNIPYYNPNYIGGNGGFTGGYSIIINGYMFEDGVFNEKLYKEKLAHEIAHVLCYKWTRDYYCNDVTWIKEHEEYGLKL